jgi:hypothetical protein
LGFAHSDISISRINSPFLARFCLQLKARTSGPVLFVFGLDGLLIGVDVAVYHINCWQDQAASLNTQPIVTRHLNSDAEAKHAISFGYLCAFASRPAVTILGCTLREPRLASFPRDRDSCISSTTAAA